MRQYRNGLERLVGFIVLAVAAHHTQSLLLCFEDIGRRFVSDFEQRVNLSMWGTATAIMLQEQQTSLNSLDL